MINEGALLAFLGHMCKHGMIFVWCFGVLFIHLMNAAEVHQIHLSSVDFSQMFKNDVTPGKEKPVSFNHI